MLRLVLGSLLVLAWAARAFAYVDASPTLGTVINDSDSITVLQVEKVSSEKRVVIYRKIADVKGTYPAEQIKHAITDGAHPREPRRILDWASPGKIAICFHNGKVAQTCIGSYWYECHAGEPPWWYLSRGRPDLSLAYSGRPEKLRTALVDILAGKEVIITALMHGAHGVAAYDEVMFKGPLRGKAYPVWRIRASLKMPGSQADIQTDPKFSGRPGAGTADDVPPLAKLLREPDPSKRGLAAEDLGLIGLAAKSAVPALVEALHDKDEFVVVAAAGALGRIEPEHSATEPALRKLLASKSAEVRRAAAEGLGDLGTAAASSVPRLLELFHDASFEVRWAAV